MASSPPRRGEELTSSGKATIRFAKYLEGLSGDLTEITNAIAAILLRLTIIEADIAAIIVRLDAIDAEIVLIEARLGALEAIQFIQTTTAVDLTTTRYQVIRCTNTLPIIITLNASPVDGEELYITKRNTGSVTVSGTVNGKASTKLAIRYNTVHLIFFEDLGEWGIA